MNKNELLVRARLLMVNFKPENRMPSLLDTPVKEYKLPTLARSEFEDAFDEIGLLSFPVSCSPFDLLQTKYRGGVRANELTSYHKQTVKILAYLVPVNTFLQNAGKCFSVHGLTLKETILIRRIFPIA